MSEADSLVAAIEQSPFDVAGQKVFADWLEEHGLPDSAVWLRSNGSYQRKLRDGDGYGDGDGGYGYGDGGYGDGDGDGDGDGGYGDGYGDGGDGGDGGYGDGGYGDGYGDGDGGYGSGDGGYGSGDLINNIRSYAVKDGLHILSMAGGYSPYVLIGWVKRQDFLLRVLGGRIIRRFGRNGQLAKLATDGPIKGENPTQLLEASREEFVALSAVSRAIPCNPERWAKECPKPEPELTEAES